MCNLVKSVVSRNQCNLRNLRIPNLSDSLSREGEVGSNLDAILFCSFGVPERLRSNHLGQSYLISFSVPALMSLAVGMRS